jgi:hypothetical protein
MAWYQMVERKIMEIQIFYVFIPTVFLAEVAKTANQEYLARVSVWTGKEYSRTGKEHSQDEVESAFWLLFLANLIESDPEPVEIRQMRDSCLKLGFSSCWDVVCTSDGGDISDLLAESIRARSFLQEFGFTTNGGGLNREVQHRN